MEWGDTRCAAGARNPPRTPASNPLRSPSHVPDLANGPCRLVGGTQPCPRKMVRRQRRRMATAGNPGGLSSTTNLPAPHWHRKRSAVRNTGRSHPAPPATWRPVRSSGPAAAGRLAERPRRPLRKHRRPLSTGHRHSLRPSAARRHAGRAVDPRAHALAGDPPETSQHRLRRGATGAEPDSYGVTAAGRGCRARRSDRAAGHAAAAAPSHRASARPGS
ncbi:Uncharacterised protein [Mycolicibacter terrae]|nr:Uncharacterised protein [Mycolicibacter terrae]